MLDWLPGYRREWLTGDLAAGMAVTALVVPKNLGYAEIAGIPVQNGLYAAAAGALLYAMFGTSRQISTGPSSSLAAVAGGAVLVTGVAGEEAASLVAAIAIVTGALFLLLAIFKLGWIARLLSKAVVTGFLAGAAIDVIVGELPKLTGTSADGTNSIQELVSWVQGLDAINWPTVAIGAASLVTILSLRKLSPGAPGALVLVAGGLIASSVLDLDAHGVTLVGDVPSGLPAFVIPDASLFGDHAPAIIVSAFALLLIGFSQTAGDARLFAARHRYRVDVNQESVAQGMANVGAGVFQGMPVSTSLSASSLNESSGARTPVASLATGGLLVLTLIFLAPLFADLPKAVLAAVIIDAVAFGMIDIAELKRLRRVARVDYWIALAAIAGALLSGVLFGVVIGVALSLLWLVYVTTSPAMPVLGRKPGTQVFRDHGEYADDEVVPGVVVLRIDSGLFFATAEALEDRVRELMPADNEDVFALVLDLEGVNFVDSQGVEKVASLKELVETRNAELHLARVKPGVRAVMVADGSERWLGEGRIHGNVHEAVEAALRSRR